MSGAVTAPNNPTQELELVERTAKAIHDHWKNNLTPWEETCEKLPGAADFFRDCATAALHAVHEALKPVAWRYWDEDEESWLLCGTDPTEFCATTSGYSKPEKLFALSSPLGEEREPVDCENSGGKV